MKYEAKNAGSNVPTSTLAGFPWANVNQTDAITYSPNVAGCTGCHLITESEWLTIAQNVLSVASNWSSNAVGSGYIFSGHSDASSAALIASTDDIGYSGTGDSAPSNQRRILTLTNGEVIWDLAGNIWEWTAGQTTGVQPGITGLGYNWRDWPSVTNPGTLPVNPGASITGLTGASSWNSTYGIGQLYSSSDEIGLRGFIRGGNWGSFGHSGVLALNIDYIPSSVGSYIGFRVAR